MKQDIDWSRRYSSVRSVVIPISGDFILIKIVSVKHPTTIGLSDLAATLYGITTSLHILMLQAARN